MSGFFKLYISLGSTCCVAYQLNKLKLRNMALPFDWIRTNNINQLTKCLEDSFEKFCDFKSFGNKKDFTLQETDDFIDDSTLGTLNVKNGYNMSFLHDFRIDLDNSSDIIKKYQKRIERFYQIIVGSDNNTKIIFVRYDLSYNKDNILNLLDALNKICPHDYSLLLIINQSKPIINDFTNDKIIIKQINCHSIDWKLDFVEWKDLFNI